MSKKKSKSSREGVDETDAKHRHAAACHLAGADRPGASAQPELFGAGHPDGDTGSRRRRADRRGALGQLRSAPVVALRIAALLELFRQARQVQVRLAAFLE